MKNKGGAIKQYELSPQARAGVIVENMEEHEADEHDISKPHRDDHCQLMIAKSGEFKLNIDFENVEFTAPAILIVFPEQVHSVIEVKDPKGWVIAFDPSLADKEVLRFLENTINNQFLSAEESIFFQQLTVLTNLIGDVQQKNKNYYGQKSILSLLDGLLSLIAGQLASCFPVYKEKENRRIVIKDAFINLIKTHFKTWKQPSQYASVLSISPAHLNDTIKLLTGGTVSGHIQAASITEAKRLLYFTDRTVREIAYEVGYEEPVYFGKLFKKVTDLTPLEFRHKFRDQDYPSPD